MAGGDKLRMRENKKNVDRVKRELEYREMQECTFKPKTLAKTGRRASDRSLASVAGVETYFRKIQQLQARKA